MSWLIYLRKSRADLEAEARGEGETLARHERLLTDLAARLNLEIGAVYREIVSGETISARPVMRRLLSEVEAGRWEGVLVAEVERLARGDTIDQGTVARAFRYAGAKIATPLRVYDPSDPFDEEYFEFGLFMSRREYKTINRRLQQGRAASAREGKFVGNIPPYGYERVKLAHQKGFSLALLEQEAEIVRLIFALGAAEPPLGAAGTAARLNALGVPTRGGGPWTAGAVRGILRNPVYTGKIRWNSRPAVKRLEDGLPAVSRPRNPAPLLTEGLHPPIVDAALWERVQRPSAPLGKRPLQNPLAGLVLCGVCGKPMQRRPYPGRPDELLCATPGCRTVGSDLSDVLEGVRAGLLRWYGEQVFSLPAARAEAPALPPRRLEREAAALERQLGALHDLLEQGVYTPEVFRRRRETLLERLGRLEMERERLSGVLPEEAGRSGTASLAELLTGGDPASLNRLLGALLEAAVYTKERTGRWDPRQRRGFRLDLFMKLPGRRPGDPQSKD